MGIRSGWGNCLFFGDYSLELRPKTLYYFHNDARGGYADIMRQKIPALFLCAALIVAALAARPALATLGEPAGSIASDQKALSALRSSSSVHENYTVQQVESAAVTVREYISPSGIVFGVAWNGMTTPRPDTASRYLFHRLPTGPEAGAPQTRAPVQPGKNRPRHRGNMGPHAEPARTRLCACLDPFGSDYR